MEMPPCGKAGPGRLLPELAHRGWTAVTVFVIVLTLVVHVAWIALDGRMPVDLGIYYTTIPTFFRAFHGDPMPWSSLIAPGGWYNVLLAGILAIFGRSAEAFRGVDVCWVALVLVCTGGIARRVSGIRGAYVAVTLMSVMPVIVVNGRMGSIHLPETALVLCIAWAWLADPGMARPRTLVVHTLAGGLAIALRPSGLIWVGALLPFLAWGDGVRRPGWRILVPLSVWVPCAILDGMAMDRYLSSKWSARDRYKIDVPDVFFQLLGQLGLALYVVLALSLLGVRRPLTPRVLFGAWAGGPIVLWIVFRAGIDNFPLMAPGFALLAAGSAERIPRLAPLLATLGLGLYLNAHLLPPSSTPPPGSPVARLFWRGMAEPWNNARPWSGYGARELRPLLDGVCPADVPCTIVVDQGLLQPYAEEDGYLGLFLSGADRVSLVGVRHGMPRISHIDALVHFECPMQDPHFRRRFPTSGAVTATLIRGFFLERAWESSYGHECRVRWYTPHGAVPRADLLPPSQDLGAPPTG